MIMFLHFRDLTPLITGEETAKSLEEEKIGKSVLQAVVHPDTLGRADCNEDMEAIN